MFSNVNTAFFDTGGGFHLHFIDESKAMSGDTLKELKHRRPDVVEALKNWNTNERKIAVIGTHVFLVGRKHYRSKFDMDRLAAATDEMMSKWVGTRGTIFKVYFDDMILMEYCHKLCDKYPNINISFCSKLVTTELH